MRSSSSLSFKLIRRAFSTSVPARAGTGSIPTDGRIYVSSSTNPYFNLSIEDYLFRHITDPKQEVLFLYRDTPCVVIGRHQVPWTEINFPALHKADIPFLRRRSGGGAVYHDLGNTNYSIHTAREAFDRTKTGNLVARAVRRLDIDARMNERNDLVVGPNKVSGSAYKLVNKRAYHHGTMLINSELHTLGDVLRPTKLGLISKGVSSVRSPVCNLDKHRPGLTHEDFVDAFASEFRATYNVSGDEPVRHSTFLLSCNLRYVQIRTIHENEETLSVEHVKKGMEELRSWQWEFGQTPEFTHPLSNTFQWGTVVCISPFPATMKRCSKHPQSAEMHSKHGLVTACKLTLTADSDASVPHDTRQKILDNLGEALVDTKYAFLDPGMFEATRKEAAEQGQEQEKLHDEVLEWLAAETRR
jgi:lipoate-protein ligase A